MTQKPTITVLMPVYNAGQYIAEAVRSVLEQRFTDFELLIVNDGSTDTTVSVIAEFNDARIRILHQPQSGISVALNNGLAEAKADFIARFDADDVCLPDRLEKQYAFLMAHPDHVIVGCDAEYTDQFGGYVFTYRIPAHTDKAIRSLPVLVCPFVHSGVMYLRAAVLEAGGYDLNAHTFEDHLLWRKLLELGRGHNLREVLLRVRLNPQSVTIDEQWRPAAFLRLKYSALEKGNITDEEGKVLAGLLSEQENGHIKEGAYYSLLAKKYLWDNHQPVKARTALREWIRQYPVNWQAYGLYLFSYLPGQWIKSIYRAGQKNKNNAD